MYVNDIITTVTVFTALISVVFAFYNNRKSIYINTITVARIKYLENFRNLIADFGSNVLSGNKNITENENFKAILRLSFIIKLNLDKNHPFDKKIIEKINFIIEHYIDGNKDTLTNEINSLIELAQDLALLEWRGVKNEATKGILGKRKKKDLVNNHLKY